MSNHITPAPDLPPTVRERAEKAGRDAAEAFTLQYRAEMKAHKHERANRGTTQARWLTDDPCPAWCVGGIDHGDGTAPDDRCHFSPTTAVELVTMEPVVMGYPERWAPPDFQISMDRRYREREPRLTLGVGDETFAFATLDEAERIAGAILELVGQARGGWKPTVLPYDRHGQCDSAECVTCRAEGEQVGA